MIARSSLSGDGTTIIITIIDGALKRAFEYRAGLTPAGFCLRCLPRRGRPRGRSLYLGRSGPPANDALCSMAIGVDGLPISTPCTAASTMRSQNLLEQRYRLASSDSLSIVLQAATASAKVLNGEPGTLTASLVGLSGARVPNSLPRWEIDQVLLGYLNSGAAFSWSALASMLACHFLSLAS